RVPARTCERRSTSLMAGGSADALTRARMLKKSVLDFGLRDLKKLRGLAPSSEYERLDAHEAAIRALEVELEDAPATSGMCGRGEEPEKFQPFVDGQGNRIGNGTYS